MYIELLDNSVEQNEYLIDSTGMKSIFREKLMNAAQNSPGRML